MRVWLYSELWALLVPTQDTSPVWKKAQLRVRSEFRDIISTLLHRDGQTLVHLHSKNPPVHTLLPPAWLWFNFSLQDKVKINTGSAAFPLLIAMEAAQILNHEDNMEKWSRKEMEAVNLPAKCPEILVAAWRMELLLAQNKYLTLKKTVFPSKVTFCAGHFSKQHRNTGLSSISLWKTDCVSFVRETISVMGGILMPGLS